jgi:hypothetical protein
MRHFLSVLAFRNFHKHFSPIAFIKSPSGQGSSNSTVSVALFVKLIVLFLLSNFTVSISTAHAQTASVKLAWNLPSDLTGITEYRIYVRPSSGTYSSTFTQVLGASTNTITLNNLTAGSYFFVAKSYNGTLESTASNEVAITAAVATLEGRTAALTNNRVFQVQAFNVGQTTSPLVDVSCTANSSGMITIPTGATGLPATFDLRLKSAGYLAKRAASRTLIATNALPVLLAGDLNSDPNPANINTINSFDYGILKQQWFGADPISDFNGDGIVNGLDYSLLKKNWFLSDDV